MAVRELDQEKGQPVRELIKILGGACRFHSEWLEVTHCSFPRRQWLRGLSSSRMPTGTLGLGHSTSSPVRETN